MQALLGRGAALRGAMPRACGRAPLAGAVAPLQRLAAPSRRYSDATTTRAAIEAPYEAGAAESPATSRVYSSWTVYKTKGAMSVKFLKPTWANASNGFTVDRAGKVLLEFAAASGERQYNWDSKIMLAMSVTELGQIFAEPNAEHSFFHDPNMMDPSAKGSMTKSLRWAPAPDGKAYFVSASLGGSAPGATKSSVSVTLSKAEFYVFETLGRFAIPHLLGMDMVFNSSS